VCWLTAAELVDALGYLERHRPDDEVLGRAVAAEFARRTAATEFADRTATALPPRSDHPPDSGAWRDGRPGPPGPV
jgi:hypothetical protein